MRRKLDRLAENFSNKKPYYVTLTDAELWFDILNNIIFKRKLPPFDTIEIKRLRDCVGAVLLEDSKKKKQESHLQLHYVMKDFKTFLEVLGHEMVHHWQYWFIKDSTCDHNADFYSWRRRFSANGLKLTLRIDNDRRSID